jgi:hypothetical protein
MPKTASMKTLIIAAMLQIPGHRGQIKEIKAKMLQMFGERLCRSQDYELTFGKAFSRYKNLFIKSAAIYEHVQLAGGQQSSSSCSDPNSLLIPDETMS